jgi:RNA polymerase sigma-70 factor (sigma-E family)
VKPSRREAFEALCREEYAAVVRTAWLITGDREEALDVAQETFARAYERWRTVQDLDRPAAWLQRVAGNLALSWRRREKRYLRTQVSARTMEPPETADEELLAALRALTPAQRTAIVLRFYGDLSVDDTASALGKRPGTIRALTSQGMERLRTLLATVEVDDERS